LPAALSGRSARYAQLTGRWGWMLASGIVDLILAGSLMNYFQLDASARFPE
jgi:hypothetical protein